MLAWTAGDVAAFEMLYARHRGPSVPVPAAAAARSGALADEFFQDVWQRVIAARAGWKPDAAFRTWLFRIAHNRLNDHWRATQAPPARARRTPTSARPGYPIPSTPRARTVRVRAASPPATGDRGTARRTARGGAAAPGAGTEPGGNRRDHRRRPGNREVAASLRDGQAARETERMKPSRPRTAEPGRARAGATDLARLGAARRAVAGAGREDPGRGARGAGTQAAIPPPQTLVGRWPWVWRSRASSITGAGMAAAAASLVQSGAGAGSCGRPAPASATAARGRRHGLRSALRDHRVLPPLRRQSASRRLRLRTKVRLQPCTHDGCSRRLWPRPERALASRRIGRTAAAAGAGTGGTGATKLARLPGRSRRPGQPDAQRAVRRSPATCTGSAPYPWPRLAAYVSGDGRRPRLHRFRAWRLAAARSEADTQRQLDDRCRKAARRSRDAAQKRDTGRQIARRARRAEPCERTELDRIEVTGSRA